LFGGTNITYQWRVLPGGSYINSTGTDTTISIATPLAYQVELRVCNAECGCNSSLQDVTVQDLEPAIGASPMNACLNTPINFSGNATIEPSPPIVNPNITSYTWNFGDPGSGVNNTSNAQNPVHTFVGPGSSFTVSLIVDGLCGPDTTTLVMNLHARPRVTITPANQTICQGNPGQPYIFNQQRHSADHLYLDRLGHHHQPGQCQYFRDRSCPGRTDMSSTCTLSTATTAWPTQRPMSPSVRSL
jgi:hypothetical protein